MCKEVNCGKGTCKFSSNSPFFECECQPGWKQTASGKGDYPKFLPCVIPNCKPFFLSFSLIMMVIKQMILISSIQFYSVPYISARKILACSCLVLYKNISYYLSSDFKYRFKIVFYIWSLIWVDFTLGFFYFLFLQNNSLFFSPIANWKLDSRFFFKNTLLSYYHEILVFLI